MNEEVLTNERVSGVCPDCGLQNCSAPVPYPPEPRFPLFPCSICGALFYSKSGALACTNGHPQSSPTFTFSGWNTVSNANATTTGNLMWIQ